MRGKIKKPNKNAACMVGRTARKELLRRSYRKSEQLSSLKTLIGEILLFGNKRHEGFWPLFDVMLRQYFYQKVSQSVDCSPCSLTGMNKSCQRVVD